MSTITASANQMPCQIRLIGICNHDPATTVWAHANGSAAGKGIGMKSHDLLGAYGCSACHDIYDRRAPLPAAYSREMVERVSRRAPAKPAPADRAGNHCGPPRESSGDHVKPRISFADLRWMSAFEKLEEGSKVMFKGAEYKVSWKHREPNWIQLKARKGGLMVRQGDAVIHELTQCR